MSVTLPKDCEDLARRLIESGRYASVEEVLRAGLRTLSNDTARYPQAYPPGSLRECYTPESDEEELRLLRGSSLRVEPE
jgi:Arc/MetJ-type ribon-helix-helix transcriptional regulator